jgi:integrase
LKARYKVWSIKTDLVFYNREGESIDARNLLRAFYIAEEKAGIQDLRFHDLRHTFVSAYSSSPAGMGGPAP